MDSGHLTVCEEKLQFGRSAAMSSLTMEEEKADFLFCFVKTIVPIVYHFDAEIRRHFSFSPHRAAFLSFLEYLILRNADPTTGFRKCRSNDQLLEMPIQRPAFRMSVD